MENCIFCKVIKGELPSAKFWEDDEFMAILDLNPNTEGMSLVLPKKHFDSDVFSMPDDDYSKLLQACKKVSELLKQSLKVKRVALVMEGMGVNHAHVKLYPMHGLEDEFKEMAAAKQDFFVKYPGYITTVPGPRADSQNLQKLAGEIKKKAV